MNYYNEIDPYCAAWLQTLMDAGHIASGVIDTRSIEDVRPDELNGYVQCHFFAGLGGWAYALDLAGWPRDRHVWTGSCPCQPFRKQQSVAWDADWESALRALRAVDDGIQRCVEATDACRNAIVPQVAAQFIGAYTDCFK